MKFKSILPFIIFLFFFLVYSQFACRLNPGYADSDEIITNAYNLGVAHPPGYPLQIVLTHFFQKLPIPGTIAFRSNLFSSLLHSIALSIFYLICYKLISRVSKNSKFNTLVSLLSVFTLAFSTIFWLYSGITEVWSLGSLFLVTIIYLALLWQESLTKKNHKEIIYLILISIIYGIALAHLQPFILLSPGLLVFLITNLPKDKNWIQKLILQIILVLVLVTSLFLLTNSIMFLLNKNQANFSWYFDQSFPGWWSQITRKAYSGYRVEEDSQSPAYFSFSNLDLSKHFRGIFEYTYYICQHLSVLSVLLAILGFSYLAKKNKILFWQLLSLFAFPGILFGAYMGFPENDLNNLRYRTEVGITHRHYIIGEILLSLLIPFGAYYFTKLIDKNNKKPKQTPIYIYFILGLIVAYNFIYNFNSSNQRNYTGANDYAKIILDQAEPDSIIICAADFSCFSLAHAQEVEGYRTDVSVIGKAKYIKKYYLERHSDLMGYDYLDNPYYLAELISWNVAKRPTYLTDLQNFYIEFIGLNSDPFYLVPKEYMFQVATKVPDEFPKYDYALSSYILNYPKAPQNYWRTGFQDYLSNFHVTNGLLYSYYGQSDFARTNMKFTMELSPGYERARDLHSSLINFTGFPSYQKGKESSPSAYFYDLSQKKLEEGNIIEAYNQARKATYLEPLSRDYRFALAQIYEKGNYYKFAAWEYEYILKHFPDDQEAKMNLDRIKNTIPQFQL